ncbi:hypothetical protein GDO81_018268 [Engystomops pustulosus]|uniref:Uncharacterized protein n=1 Tax=Engystomops pustulosus TaxID=76066 RepID=A0AAV7AFW1_ENGPU|nr:hypothetical protein GDO81_018268 [Engystomops pustulosus]
MYHPAGTANYTNQQVSDPKSNNIGNDREDGNLRCSSAHRTQSAPAPGCLPAPWMLLRALLNVTLHSATYNRRTSPPAVSIEEAHYTVDE